MDRKAEKATAAAIVAALAVTSCGGVAPYTCYDVTGTYQPLNRSYGPYTHTRRECTDKGAPQPVCNPFENSDISFSGGAKLTDCKVKQVTSE